MVAAFTGLALTNNISQLPDKQRKALIVMSSFVLGGGIWSMHFVAMLAHRFQIPVYYDVFQTLSSALVAILVVGTALLLLHFTRRSPPVLVVAGLILGGGILSMHYIGMLGIRGTVPVFTALSSGLSGVVACVMGVAAIRVAYGHRSRQNIVMGALVMGFSVVAVHYTAMHGTRFMASTEVVPPGSAVLATDTLAVIVTLAVFVICGTFLLAATTFLTAPDRLSQPHSVRDTDHSQPAQPTAAAQPAVQSPTSPQSTMVAEDEPPASIRPDPVAAEVLPDPVRIPFEKDKKIGFAASDQVAAIRADGHYTHLYTRDGIRFCPWSITEAEKRLAGAGYHRTHRSYLVNVSAVAGYRKRKETGLCLFEDYPQLTSVPVSRNRVIGLLEVLDTATS